MAFLRLQKRLHPRHWFLIASVLAVTIVGTSTLTAQAPSKIERLTLQRGTFFEIVADHTLGGAQYSWALSRGDTFLEAGRKSVYRTRLTDAGTYTLRLELKSQHAAESIQRTLRIEVPTKSTPSSPTSQRNGAATLVTTDPATDTKSRIPISETQTVLQLIPAPDTAALTADINNEYDSNGDSNPLNDDDTAGTFFSSRATPLFVWLTDSVSDQKLTVRGRDASGATKTQTLHLMDSRTLREADEQEQRARSIQSEEFNEGRVAFRFTSSYATDLPLLYHWTFGDGQESLLDAPMHTYRENGRYNVAVRVHDLQTGEEIEDASSRITVTSAVGSPQAPPDEEEPAEEGEGLPISSIVKIGIKVLLVGLLSLLVGLSVIFIIAKVRKGSGSLEDKLADAEKKFVGDEKKEKEEEKEAGHMEIIDAETEESEPAKEVEKKEQRKEKTSSQAKPEKEDAASTPKPEKKKTPPIPKPEINEPPPKLQEPPQAQGDVPLPDWLQPKEGDNEPLTPPAEEPQATAVPASTEPPPAPPPEENAATPDWLKTGTPSAAKPAEPKGPAAPAEEPKPEGPGEAPLAQEAPAPPWLQAAEKQQTPLPPPAPAASELPPAPPPSAPPQPSPPPTPPQALESKTPEPQPEGPGDAAVAEQAPAPPWLQAAEKKEAPPPPASPEPKPASPEPGRGEPQPESDEPVAFVSADSISAEDSPPPPPPPSLEENNTQEGKKAA